MKRFNIRVYGLLMHAEKGVLVTDEIVGNMRLTKFPGGGLEFGEGTRDCLKREFMEEFGLKIKVEEHFYTTDFFVVSAFNPQDQIISIYYKVSAEFYPDYGNKLPFSFSDEEMAKYEAEEETETARYIAWNDLDPEIFTLPIDKLVCSMIPLP